MTFDEFAKIAKGLKAAYTSEKFLPDKDALKIWYGLLKDLTYEQASVAAMAYMSINKFPPTIADIREQAIKTSNADLTDNWSDGWA